MEQRYIAGDWVRYIGVASPIVAQITEVREDNLLIDLGECNWYLADYSEVDSIRLTGEILEKNGWEKSRIYFTNRRIPRIKLCSDKSESKWSVSINGDIMGGYIYNVHDLQHILFAFRIEQEIEV
jgi:hypothetical protein